MTHPNNPVSENEARMRAFLKYKLKEPELHVEDSSMWKEFLSVLDAKDTHLKEVVEPLVEALKWVRKGVFNTAISYDKNKPIEEQGIQWANSWFNLEKLEEALTNYQKQILTGESEKEK